MCTVYAARSAGCLVVGEGGGRELGGDGDIDLVVMGIKEAVFVNCLSCLHDWA